MSGRMEADANRTDLESFSKRMGAGADIRPEPGAKEPFAASGSVVELAPFAGVIAVRVGDHRAFDRARRVNVKIPRFAI